MLEKSSRPGRIRQGSYLVLHEQVATVFPSPSSPFLIALLPAFAQGQCIMGNLNAPQTDPTNVDIGQSFTPTCNGAIEYVDIFTTNGGTNAAGTLQHLQQQHGAGHTHPHAGLPGHHGEPG